MRQREGGPKRANRGSQPTAPDEAFQWGPLVVARYGRFVTIRNIMSAQDFPAFQHDLALKYPEVRASIDARVARIRAQLQSLDPLTMLRDGYFYGAARMIGKTSEIHYSGDDLAIVPMLEYVQSIYAGQSLVAPLRQPTAAEWETVRREVTDLYQEVTHHHAIARTAFLRSLGGYDEALDWFLRRAEMLWINVRCHRYPGHDLLSLTELLAPQDGVLRDVFGVSAADIVAGFGKVQEILTVAPLTILDQARAQSGSDPETFWQLVMQSPLGTGALFDITTATGLPESLLGELSSGPGEEPEFLNVDPFPGWPTRTLPVQRRPFLKLNGRYYCFSHVSLMDNAYRLIERTTCRIRPDHRQVWNNGQKAASESSAVAFLTRLLPGARVLTNVFYPTAGRRERGETDAIVLYDDHLLVVEVKAGAFAPGSPTLDATAQLLSIAGLVEKPTGQAHRFLEYLESAPEVTLYDEQNKAVATLKRSDFRVITCCAVTLDQLTSLACQVEWLDGLGGVRLREKPVWPVSLDDLRVYAEIIDIPVMFAHFLEERRRAFASPLIKLDDELDHLGLYLKHGRYVTHAELVAPKDVLSWTGYREAIDTYFYNLDVAPTAARKPAQLMPARMEEVLRKISESGLPGRCRCGGRLLEIDTPGRIEFARNLEESIDRCLSGTGQRASWLVGGVRMMVFCSRDFSDPPRSFLRDYLSGMLLSAGESEGLILRITPDEQRAVSAIDIVPVSVVRLGPAESQRLREAARYEAVRRVTHKLAAGSIGRNDQCPCHSGKKFKRCCSDLARNVPG